VFRACPNWITLEADTDTRRTHQFALSKLPRSKSSSLYAAYTKFEKQHGTRSTVEATVWNKRRIQYEDDVSNDPFNYDTWFDFARLEEDALRSLRDDGEDEEQIDKAVARVREVYERAVAKVPLASEKHMWRRYIFLWLYYAVFEETETKVCLQPKRVNTFLTFSCLSLFEIIRDF
jgi:crooked neck